MQFVRKQGDTLFIDSLFNEQHAADLIGNLKPTCNTLVFHNVGVKVMRLILGYFLETAVREVVVDYNWNTIMTTPQLVCYDKNQWKTLQQLNNWNREWSELFTSCYYVERVTMNVQCSWMDEQFSRVLLEGVARIPNIKVVSVRLASKTGGVRDILTAFEKAKLFVEFRQEFVQLQ